ncbi:hypothetical protein CVT26_000991 [Gymnopilus dilepis]|uniref:CHAT domain-containing protein n=1 Tax=Gymnopilus dilepis TaxID=231916 RepID=A0A409YLB4_9AGAR|nr:hypothetical protein CVT26_000991 [Gymnopilus dilepis]
MAKLDRPLPALKISVIVSSNDSEDLARFQIDLSDWSPPTEGPSETKSANFQTWKSQPSGAHPNFTLSLEVKDLVPEELIGRLQADRESADPSELYVYIQLCIPDQSTKAVMLNLCGDKFRDKFATTRNEGDIRAAIKAYADAIACLPEGDPNLANFTGDLGMGYYTCYDTFGKAPDAHDAIMKLETAVELTPDGDEDLLRWLDNLANAYLRRFEWTGELGDISEAIQLRRVAVKITPEGFEYLPILLTNLGVSFFRRFERVGDVADIAEAIQVQQRAVELAAEESSYLPSVLADLGNSFLRRFEVTGDMEDVLKSIEHQARAVQLASDKHPKAANFLDNLGASYIARFERTGDMEDIAESIRLRRRAVELTSSGHPFLPTRLSNLGNSLIRRFERTGELADINEAIKVQQEAVRLVPDGHADLPALLNGLGTSFFRRFDSSGELADISEAIQLQQRAVHLTPEGHADLPAWLSNLGSSFLTRFERNGELADLDESIQLQKRAVKLTPDSHADLPIRLSNLGMSLTNRFEKSKDPADAAESIKHQQRAVELTSEDHTIAHVLLNNLGIAFLHRFRELGEVNDLSESIRLWQRGIQLTPEDSANLPGMLNNVGTSLLARFDKTGDLEDISESIRVRKRAVELTSEGHADLPAWLNNVGASYLRLYERTNQQDALESALENFRLAALSSTGAPSVCMLGARNWAALLKRSSSTSPAQLLEAHERIIQLLTLITGFENTLKQRQELLIQSSQLSTAAAAAALSVNSPVKALEFLEQGRCIVWAQLNQLRTPLDDLRMQDPVKAERLSAISRQLEAAGSRLDPRHSGVVLSMEAKISLQNEAHNHVKLAKERDALLSEVRNIPGFENFLKPRSYKDLMSKLPLEGCVVILNADTERCDAIALMAGHEEPMHIPLKKFTYTRAKRLAEGLRRYLFSRRLRSRYSDSEIEVEARAIAPARLGARINVHELLATLWNDLVQPILQALPLIERSDNGQNLSRIWWCPTGPFAFLPIHAAGIYKEETATSPCDALSNFAISSYIPTLTILERLQRRSNIKGTAYQVLLVGQPDTPGLAKIPCTVEEVQQTHEELSKRGVPSTIYMSKDATAERVMESLESYPFVHLACHASQGLKDPLESAIHLYYRPLKLSEIMKKSLPEAEFVFMSACQTSTGDDNLPEEAIHLAAGMLAAGYRSVVATMWSISDKHAPQIAELFYKNMFGNNLPEAGLTMDVAASARALHFAVCNLRESSENSTEALLAWIPYVHFGV